MKNKILIVTPKLSSIGGVSSYWNTLLPILCNYNNLNINTLEVGGHGKNIFAILHDQWKFKKEIDNKINLIFLNPSLASRSFFRDALFAKQLQNKKISFVVFFHGWNLDFERQVNRKYVDFFLKTFGKAEKIFVLSEDFKNKIYQWGYKGEVIVETTNVDSSIITNFSINDKITAFKTSKKVKILFLARILREKGIFETVEAFKNLTKRYSNIQLTIVGDGKDLNKLKNEVKDNKNIIVTGYIKGKEKNDFFANNDIYCLPTFYGEGLPTTILEAMMFGMPIITTNFGGLKEFFQDGKMGYFVEPKNVNDLEKKLEHLLLDKARMIEIRKYNYAFVNEKFSSKVIAKRLYQYILNVIKNG
ncbi:hypothetical protein TSL6_10290 [Sulfurovum sp. TSL6]|uniref:glycosyltransferase family 4 protein n=1 Tax=Sulfurovum sp. TSL6 TaxID=2826995 RepID=UPI001CC62E65|nr:glycosyltransferase family 4 protein [Sulfurovum sp. TSL6]GIU00523.1 hypothetical protein TSL6_10290 [Sulfurovum sp. TSL6]